MNVTRSGIFAHRLVVAVCLVAVSLAAARVQGATLLVNNTSDAGVGTLRQALQDNESLGGGNTVVFVGGAVGIITLTSGELVIGTNVTLVGPGADVLTVSGNNASRVLRVTNAVASISGLSFANGFTGPGIRGGGIHNSATLTLSNCVMATCVGGIGGGIWNQGALLIRNSVVRNNSSAGSSGGIANTGTLGLVSSSVMNNIYTGVTPGDAAGIFGGAEITNCTVAGNSGGFGTIAAGSYTIRNTTIASNNNVGIYAVPGSASVGSCIIAGNAGGSDVAGTFTSAGYNLVGRTNGSSGWGVAGDQLGTAASPLNPKLLAPGLYGGTTPTMPPASGSPAIDQGQSFGALLDQRGHLRPFDQTTPNAALGDGSDIGAVELSPAIIVVANTNDNGANSLRQAIASASSVDNDSITFATNVVGNIGLTTGELVIGKSLNIQGSTTVPITINGNNTNRIFRFASNSVVTISSLTIANARTAADGGAMYNESGCTLALSNCAVTANVSGGNGGGLANNGSFAAYNCTFSGNQAALNAGAIYTYAGPVTLRNCTVVSNTAVAANGTGGGILNYSLVAGTSNNLGNTIVAGNSAASHPDVIGVFTSSGYNLIGKIDYITQVGGGANGVTTSGLTNNVNHDQVGSIGGPIDPLLGPLQANGGSTLMMAPLPGSPAIDQGNSPGILTDQRGRARPNDNPAIINAVGGDGSDIGAVEITPSTLIVANTNDSGTGSLRQTVLDAAAGDAISFAPNVTGAITFSNSAVALSQDVTIQGPGARLLAINGSTNNHIFTVSTGAVVIADLTLSNGRSINGGGIQLGGGALILSNCVISGNSANTNSGSGGGIKASGGSLVVLNSTVTANEARFGGGIWNGGAQVAISNTTFTANQAIGGNGSDGGAILNLATLTVQSCTIVSNSAGGNINGAGGGGIRSFNVARIGNSIIAQNSAPAAEPDAGGVFISGGYNLIGARTGSNGDGLTNGVSQDQVGTTNGPIDPLVGPLQDNGGPTPTMSLLAGSPALDQGSSFGLTTDQRGAPRPFDFASLANAAGGDGSDIGAFESGSPTLNIQKLSTNAVLSWQSCYGDFTVQSVTNVIASSNWANVAGTPVAVANQYVLTNGPISGSQFYRLKNN
jgi:fibronectin-binding autotransporter adhesin